MRTLLNNIKETDDHVLGLNTPQDSFLFEAKMILNPKLRLDAGWHKQTHNLIQQYGRKQLRADLETIHLQLFTQPEYSSFRQHVLHYFKH